MNASCLKLACQIVSNAAGDLPADALLRDTLKQQRGLSPSQAREVTRLVFNWFRWCGWLDSTDDLERSFAQVVELAERFGKSPEQFPESQLCLAVPEWTWDEMNVTSEWLRSLQAEPRLWLRAKRGQRSTLARKLGECWIPKEFPDAVEYRGDEDLFRTREFQAGEFEVQDLASQAVGLLCAPQPGETWWDACAGEGGKTLHLSDLMENKGLIWASDRAEWRLKKLKLRAARAGCFNYRAVLWDGGAKPPTKTKFDGVLVDAPCSGVGTWQRNPHARWTTQPNDVRELAQVQEKLLHHTAAAVKPGGKLIYAVCSLCRAETARVVEAFQQSHDDFTSLPLALPGNEKASETLSLWPQEFGGNGMFVAAWQRKKS